MPLVKLHLPILFTIPVTIDATLRYLDQRTDKPAVWGVDKTRYEFKLQQEFPPPGNTWFHTDVLQNRLTEIFSGFKFTTVSR